MTSGGEHFSATSKRTGSGSKTYAAKAITSWRDDELRKNPNATIPAALADLKRRPRPAPRMTDPETGAEYEYLPKPERRTNCAPTSPPKIAPKPSADIL